MNISGGAPGAEDPDAEGGFRLEVYDGSYALKRRFESAEISASPTTPIFRFNGQGENNVNDTLSYGTYKLRAYASMRNPSVTATVKGSGITINRVGDMHVTSGGVLTWTNTAGLLSFCQVSLGDPTTAEPTFLRLVEFPTGFGSASSNMAYGIAMNSANEVFISDNYVGGAAAARIAKYSTASETWLNMNWATHQTPAVASGIDEYVGLGIDSKDSIYVACGSNVTGVLGGANLGFEGIIKFKDTGSYGAVVSYDSASIDLGTDNYDVAPLPNGDDFSYLAQYAADQIDAVGQSITGVTSGCTDFGTGTLLRGVTAWANGRYVYVTRKGGAATNRASFSKVGPNGRHMYTLTDATVCTGAYGITVWQKTATNETFVIVSYDSVPFGRGPRGQIRIYKENTAGDSATFVRVISCTGAGADTVVRPGDLYCDANGILSWTNCGDTLSFTQVQLNDPVSQNPTFLRRIYFPAGFGSTNTKRAWGIAANSSNEVFVADNQFGGLTKTRIAKYSTASETWLTMNWITSDSTVVAEDEYVGLGVDANNDIFVACGTNVIDVDTAGGRGAGGGWEGILKIRDRGAYGEDLGWTADQAQDNFDVVPVSEGDSKGLMFFTDYTNDQLERNQTDMLNGVSTTYRNSFVDLGAATTMRGIDITENGAGGLEAIYVTSGNAFRKINKFRNTVYTMNDARISTATGIAVWQKTSTNETFIIVASQANNQIHIYSEAAAGDTVTYVRSIEDDVYTILQPEGLAADPTGNYFYVVNRGSRAVKKFTKDGIFEPMTGAYNGKFIQGIDINADLSDSSGFNTPRAIAVDTAGYIYVFDHNVANSVISLKKFTSNGVPLGVYPIVTNPLASGGFLFSAWSNQPIVQATFGGGSLFCVSNSNNARVMKISTSGTLVQHLGTATANGGADAAEGTASNDVCDVQVASFFDRTNNVFYPSALYFYERTVAGADRMEVYSTDLSTRLLAAVTPEEGTGTNPTANNVVTFLVDEFGDPYAMNDGVSGGSYLFRKWNASTPTYTLAANSMLEATLAQTSATSGFNGPREAIWADGRGRFSLNPISGYYEQKAWICDQTNSRLQQITLQWNDVVEEDVTIALAGDTPLVVSATLSGTRTVNVDGIYYATEGVCTVQVNFNKAMMTTASPDTMTVYFKPPGGAFTQVTKLSYTSATWRGTASVTSGMTDGNAEIKVENAFDTDGTVEFISPNPNQTDFDLSDQFKPFVIDKTPPVYTLSNPPSSGDSTSQSYYTVSGQITSEATGLGATVRIINWTADTGGTQYDSVTVTADTSDGTFSTNIDLKGPAPTNNYIEVIVTDQLLNQTTLNPRRLVERQKNLGNAFIEPATTIQVNTPRSYLITYTTGQSLTGDTIKFTIPADWSAPQKTAPTTSGYVTLTSEGTFGDSVFSGQTVTIKDVVADIGQTLTLVYGDSTASTSGMAKPALDASLADATNTFRLDVQLAGETSYSGVSAQSGKSLTVPLYDSSAAVSISETGPGGDSITMPKGSETKVIVLRFSNSNIGNHTNKITQLVFKIESETGGTTQWNRYVSQVVMKNTGEGITFATVSTIPANQNLTISPADFTATQSAYRDAEFWITFSPTAQNDTVRFTFTDSSVFTVVDEASAKTLSVVEEGIGVAGRRSGLYRIIGLLAADTVYVGGDTSMTPVDVATSQIDARVIDILFRNVAPSVDSPVNTARIDKIILSVRDAAGASLIPARVLKGISISDVAGAVTYGGVDTPNIPNVGDTISIDLSGLTVGSDATVNARIWVDVVNDTVTSSKFRIRLSDTNSLTIRDNVTNVIIRAKDDPARSETLPFQTDSVTIMKKASAAVSYLTLLRADSSIVNGHLGDAIITGDAFSVGVSYTAGASRSPLRVIPSDTDLKLFIAGTDRTSEFTITAPAAKTISAGTSDTVIYAVVQNLGSSIGQLRAEVADTALDTRPRIFDNHDYTSPDVMRATLTVPVVTETATVDSSPMEPSVFTIDTSYAGAGETGVSIIKFQIKNNRSTARTLDSVAVTAVSAGSVVTLVRLYNDDGDGTLEPGVGVPPPAGMDTLVASTTLSSNDTALLTLSPTVSIAGSGGRETFFVAFDFDTTQTDGDTFDAYIPALGLRVGAENFFPNSSLNSTGNGVVEVLATRVTVTPDTQIVAVAASPQVTLKAVDAYGNIDASRNFRSGTQGYNVQVQFTYSDDDADTSNYISSTSGLTSVTPTPGVGVMSINGYLANGQGVVTMTDTEAENTTISVTSILTTGTGAAQFTNMISAAAVNLTATDSGRPDSRALNVLSVRVTNQSGSNDQVTRFGVRSSNSDNSDVTSVILFKDANGNNRIDSGTDATIATSNFANGFCDFNFLTVDVYDQDSILLMVGYNVDSTLLDWNTLDAVCDTVTIQSSGNNLVTTTLNSTPNLKADVRAVRLTFSPTADTAAKSSNVTASVAARDSYLNIDKDYTGGVTKCYFDLSQSAQFNSGLTTLTNKEHPVSGDYTQIKGNLTLGQADLVFTDATSEQTLLSVLAAPGLGGNDTGTFMFQQGITVTALSLSNTTVEPGDTNRVVLSFKVTATGTSDTVTGVAMNWLGVRTTDIGNVRLYYDVDANEVFSATADALYDGPDVFTAETVSFTGTRYVANGTSKAFFVVADVDSSSIGGDTLDAQLLIGAITTQGGAANLPDALTNSAGRDTIARVPDTLQVGQATIANRTASEDQTEIIPMQLRLSSPSATDRKFYVEKLCLRVEGPSGNRVPNTVIASARLRNNSSGVTYAYKSSVESSGDSMVFDISYDSNFSVGGTTPETILVDVVLTIAASVTQNDTFRLSMVLLDSAWVRAYDHPTGATTPQNQKNNVTVLSPSTLPLRSGIVTVQKKAELTQTALRITDLSNNDLAQVSSGEPFRVHVGVSATASRADAMIRSSDTDLTFKRSNGTIDISSEFIVSSRTYSSLTTLAAGSSDTITYDVYQGAPFSGGGETIVVNNYLASDTGPYAIDKNSQSDATKLRVYCVETATSTDAVKSDSSYATVAAVTLSNDVLSPDSKGVRVMAMRVTDLSTVDTITEVTVHLVYTAAASMIKACWVALDTNKNGTFDTGVDQRFGSISDFKSGDTIRFTGTKALGGSGDTLDVYLIINMETSPVTDSTQIKVEVPIDGFGFYNRDSLPKSVLTNSAYFRTRIIATRLQVTPDTQTVSAGNSATLTIYAYDTYGNLNVYSTNYAQVTTYAQINDTWASGKSARWSSTTYLASSQSPDPLPSAAYYDSYVTGKLSAGQANVVFTDTAAETVSIAIYTGSIPGETVIVGFSSSPSVTAVALSNLMKVSPDSTDARILVLDVAYPSMQTVVDSIYLVSENTKDTCMNYIRLWVDDGDQILSASTDSCVDTTTWASGKASLLIGGKQYTKPSGTSSVRLFITGHMATTPQVDNDTVGARIDLGGIRLNPGGFFPASGELDSINGDTQNAVIDIDAMQTGGVIRFVNPGAQTVGAAFNITLRAEDKYGNLDNVISTLGSSASRNITFSASPAVFTFNSTQMTEVSGWPGATPVARMRTGSDTISITPGSSGTITLTADVATNPPADTTIDISVSGTPPGGEFIADSLAVASDTAASGASDVEVLRFFVYNGKASAVNVQTITVKNDGTHPDTGIQSVRIAIDTNSNGIFDGGDYNFGAPGVFSSGSFARSDSTNVASSCTVNYLVLYNMSPTLTVDTKLLRARIEIGDIVCATSETASTRILRSNGFVYTAVAGSGGSVDSVLISAGSGIANNVDTAVVVVSVRDTNGVPASGSTVWLSGDTGAPITVVSSNPQTTGADGVVLFSLRTGTAGSYSYSASVNGVALGRNVIATFIAQNNSSGNNLGGNPTSNLQENSVTGSGKHYLGNVAVCSTTANTPYVYVHADGTFWQLVKEVNGGAPQVLFQHNLPVGFETGQVNFLSDVRVATTQPDTSVASGEYALCGVITRASGRRSQIFAVDLATGDSYRIQPNNPASNPSAPFTNITWRWFDMHPSGDSVITIQDGNLIAFWRTPGNAFRHHEDSVNIRYMSGWSNMYIPGGGITTNTRVYACYPSFSPDGTKLAFTLIYVSDSLPSGPPVNYAELWVLKSFSGLTFGGYPVVNPFPTLIDTSNANLVRVNTGGDTFPMMPQWTRNGDGIVYTSVRGPEWDWQKYFKGYPHEVGIYDTPVMVTRFVYYDKNNDTTPNTPIDISAENAASVGSLGAIMSKSGPDSVIYVRKSKSGANRTFELRRIGLSSEATVTSQGGVLFESGHVIVVVPASESYAQGFTIASGIPDSTPTASDSVIITGAAKRFYSPSDPASPVYFADTISIVMYYDVNDFTDTEKIGYDSDGDGIPDRTEAAVSAYFWNGSSWVDYGAVRYPNENKIEFRTTHFSQYAVGLSSEARALAFNGTVNDVIAYPNPWRSDQSATAGYSSADERYGIKLSNFPGGEVRIRIFTIAGELVNDATVNALTNTTTNPAMRITSIINTGRGTVSWNLANQSNRQIASGVYLIVMDGPGGRAVRKVAVIR